MHSMGPTHEVLNQPPPLVDYDAAAIDVPLTDGLTRLDPHADLGELGRRAGSAEVQQWATQANTATPTLRTHDRYGNRIDEVEFHPAYHRLMGLGVEHGLHALPWRERREGAHVARAALFFLLAQAEAGVGCPISMTYSGVPALRQQPELAAEWEP